MIVFRGAAGALHRALRSAGVRHRGGAEAAVGRALVRHRPARARRGSLVPVEMVWNKILTAPDSSSLTIFQNGKRTGFCQWVTSVGETFAQWDEAPPEGMTNRMENYRIEFGGDVRVSEAIKHLRFDCGLVLSTNQSWRELSVRLSARPASWEIRAVAAEQTLRIRAYDGEERFERVFRFSDLQNPDALLREFAGPSGTAGWAG